ncbi:hypothetical protein TCAL_15484, partial [Tigriopus californicus]
MVSSAGITPNPAKVKAITTYSLPTNLMWPQSFLGLANQLALFLPDFACSTLKMRELLSRHCCGCAILISKHVAKHFDPSLPTELMTDMSNLDGMSYSLIQRETNG